MNYHDIIASILNYYIHSSLRLINSKWNEQFWRNPKCVRFVNDNKCKQLIINHMEYIPYSKYLEKLCIKLNIFTKIENNYRGKELRNRIYSACRGGSLFFLQTINLNDYRKIISINKCYCLACKNNHIDIIKYLLEIKIHNCTTMSNLLDIALKEENIDMIKLAYKNIQTTTNYDYYEYYTYTKTDVIDYVKLISYCHEENRINALFSRTYDSACLRGNVEVIKHLHKVIGYKNFTNLRSLMNFESIKYLNENKLIDKKIVLVSKCHIRNLNIDKIMYLHKNMDFNKHDFINLHQNLLCIYDVDKTGINYYLKSFLNFNDNELLSLIKF